jgi:adenylate cyclase
VKLTEGEQARLFAKGTDNVEAWALGKKAWKLSVKYSRENMAKARELLERARKLDPNYSFLWAVQAQTHFVDARAGFSKSRAESYKRALESAKKALILDEDDPMAHSLLGTIYLLQRQHDKAIAEGERAIALNPNYADGYAILSQIMRYSGRFDEALTLIEKGIRLYPNPRIFYPWNLGYTYVMLGRYEQAIPIFEQILERCRKGECPLWYGRVGLIISYVELGREEEARAETEEFLRLSPSNSLEAQSRTRPYKDPVHMERFLSALRKAGIPEKPPLPLPDKPSIAVLPFVNISGDPEQEYFSDGLTEEIISALSKVPKLFVIARNSTFTYKGKPVKVQQVSKELGVRYVLEGSVRKAGDRVRITAQLIDATTGHHLWSERYDRELKDIFALQDEITMKIITAMQIKLTEGEVTRMWAKGTDNLDAYLKFLQGRKHFFRFNPDDAVLARRYFKEAIALDPEFATPYSFMGFLLLLEVRRGQSKSPQKSIGQAFKLSQKALTLNESDANGHILLARIHLTKGQHEKAMAGFERAVAVAPNSLGGLFWLGRALSRAGRPQEAIPHLKKVIRLNPLDPSLGFFGLGTAYIRMERYEEAITVLKKVLHYKPDFDIAHAWLAACYAALGRAEEAHAEASEVLKLNPKFSVKMFVKRLAIKDKAVNERYTDALRNAGLK